MIHTKTLKKKKKYKVNNEAFSEQPIADEVNKTYLGHERRANQGWVSMQQMRHADHAAAQFRACSRGYLNQCMGAQFR